MQYKNTIDAIYVNLDEIQHLVAKFGTDGDMRMIDVDLTLNKLRDVYDLMISLRQASSSGDNNTTNLNTESAPGASGVEDSITSMENIIEFSEEPEEVEKNQAKVKPIIEKEETQAEINSRVRTAKEKKFLGEIISTERPILNEELSQNKNSGDISSRLKTKPISSITAAIGLNEKFELIHNLFNDDNAKYEHTIEVLNMATNFNEAFDYLTENFNWDMNNPLVQRLLELIRRKLIVRKNEQ